MNILYLILGLIVTFIVPLGMLKLAIKWADKIDKKEKQ